MLKIGKLKLNSNVMLAPMAGVSDLPFRLLNRKFGCEFAFVEMLNVRSLSHKSRVTQQMLIAHPKDVPIGFQLLSCEEKYLINALDVLKNYKFDLLDFNCACPAKKVIRRKEGVSLMREPKKIKKLLKLLVKSSVVPVTVKIRAGWDKNSVNAVEVALIAQDAGIDGLFIHGRTREQGYSGKVDYKVIASVKKALDIPVIASGDIFSAELVKKMFDETGCDGIAVARGSLGNPWIFGEIKEYLAKGKIKNTPKQQEIIKVMLEHLDASVAFYGERNGVVIFRKFFGWYTKYFRRVRPLREQSSRAKSKNEMVGIIEKCV